jgi:hypothetical protein
LASTSRADCVAQESFQSLVGFANLFAKLLSVPFDAFHVFLHLREPLSSSCTSASSRYVAAVAKRLVRLR